MEKKMKTLKIAIQDCEDTESIFNELKEHITKLGYNKFLLYAWDTEHTKQVLSYNSMSIDPCGKTIGKINNRLLVCGQDDYLCPDCLQAQKMLKK
jgi:hypothetical protein